MIQDIAPSIFHNEYVIREPSPDDYVFIFKNRQILIRDDGDSITCPKVSDIGNDKLQFLFTINNKYNYLYLGDEDRGGYVYTNREMISNYMSFIP